MLKRSTNDIDGLKVEGTKEITAPQKGCLEVVLQRDNEKVIRYFTGNFQTLYKQCYSKSNVIMFGVC